jgi:hypothetical protein
MITAARAMRRGRPTPKMMFVFTVLHLLKNKAKPRDET